jgi:hypothetical protein
MVVKRYAPPRFISFPARRPYGRAKALFAPPPTGREK